VAMAITQTIRRGHVVENEEGEVPIDYRHRYDAKSMDTG